MVVFIVVWYIFSQIITRSVFAACFEYFTADGSDMTKVTGYYNKVLWDSQKCGTNETMFKRTIKQTTSNVTVRICRDQDRNDEDLAICILDLYVQ